MLFRSNGGSIVLEARNGVDSLVALKHRQRLRAPRGQHGQGSNRHGRNGDDVVVLVPPGTIVADVASKLVIKDLLADGDRVVAARGGKGGKGNTRFKSSTNRAPRQFTAGAEGERRIVELELKVIADVGLIGKPNAGKSTLLSRLSHARPEIADYPFTTKFPNLGQVKIDADRAFVLADIPGLIEGAHEGVGLGHEFLRHIERAGILVHLVEPTPIDGSDPVHNYHAIHEELVLYDVDLGRRPEIVAVTKAELPGAEQAHHRLSESLGRDVLLISAVTGAGLNRLTGAIGQALAQRDTIPQAAE